MTRGVGLAALLILLAGCGGATPATRQTGKNAPSIGVIDLPAPDALVAPLFAVTGWVVDEDGLVERVRIYIDDELVAAVPLTIPRPDVDKQLQLAATGAFRGYTAAVDAGLRAGHYTIRVESLDAKGGRTQFATANIKIEP